MKDSSEWRVPKLPFLAAGGVLLATAWVIILRDAHPFGGWQIALATGGVALGAVLGCLPFLLEYRAASKLVELNALGAVAEQLRDLKQFSAQVADATGQWARVQEATQGSAEKTAAAAREIAERMGAELREFNEFQAKLNDQEKSALRLETEKLRRVEGEWLQVVARMLDNIFALHTAAVRSGQPDLAEQIGGFQNACRDTARRVGLTMFGAEAGEGFDAQKHRAHGVENPPADAVIAELLAPGLSFQGRLLRPVLVRLQTAEAPVPAAEPAVAPAAEIATETTSDTAAETAAETVAEAVSEPEVEPVTAAVPTSAAEPAGEKPPAKSSGGTAESDLFSLA